MDVLIQSIVWRYSSIARLGARIRSVCNITGKFRKLEESFGQETLQNFWKVSKNKYFLFLNVFDISYIVV